MVLVLMGFAALNPSCRTFSGNRSSSARNQVSGSLFLFRRQDDKRFFGGCDLVDEVGYRLGCLFDSIFDGLSQGLLVGQGISPGGLADMWLDDARLATTSAFKGIDLIESTASATQRQLNGAAIASDPATSECAGRDSAACGASMDVRKGGRFFPPALRTPSRLRIHLQTASRRRGLCHRREVRLLPAAATRAGSRGPTCKAARRSKMA